MTIAKRLVFVLKDYYLPIFYSYSQITAVFIEFQYLSPYKLPYVRWHIKNRNLFLKVQEAGKSKIRMPADSLFGEGLLSGS